MLPLPQYAQTVYGRSLAKSVGEYLLLLAINNCVFAIKGYLTFVYTVMREFTPTT